VGAICTPSPAARQRPHIKWYTLEPGPCVAAAWARQRAAGQRIPDFLPLTLLWSAPRPSRPAGRLRSHACSPPHAVHDAMSLFAKLGRRINKPSARFEEFDQTAASDQCHINSEIQPDDTHPAMPAHTSGSLLSAELGHQDSMREGSMAAAATKSGWRGLLGRRQAQAPAAAGGGGDLLAKPAKPSVGPSPPPPASFCERLSLNHGPDPAAGVPLKPRSFSEAGNKVQILGWGGGHGRGGGWVGRGLHPSPAMQRHLARLPAAPPSCIAPTVKACFARRSQRSRCTRQPGAGMRAAQLSCCLRGSRPPRKTRQGPRAPSSLRHWRAACCQRASCSGRLVQCWLAESCGTAAPPPPHTHKHAPGSLPRRLAWQPSTTPPGRGTQAPLGSCWTAAWTSTVRTR